MEYFYLIGEDRRGPFSLEALRNEPVTLETLVWNRTMTDWMPASAVPEVAGLLTGAAPAPPYYAPAAPQATPQGGRPPMPENYLVWAIVVTICCCWPFGIPAIINANKVSSLYGQGDYAGAQQASADAKKWTIIAAIVGGVWQIIVGVIWIAMIASGELDF